MMSREYEDEQRRQRALIQEARDEYHMQYHIRKPSQNIPNYELPVVESFAGPSGEQARFPRQKHESVQNHANGSQYDDLAARKEPKDTITSTAAKNGNAFELPGLATSPLVLFASQLASSTAEPAGEVYNEDEDDLLVRIGQAKEDLAHAHERLSRQRERVALEETCIRELSAYFTALVNAYVREHSHQKRGKGARQAPRGAPHQPAPADKCPAFMQDYMPPHELAPAAPRDPNEDQNPDARWCKVGRPDPKKLLPKIDDYYDQSLCNKHKLESDFEISMGVAKSRGISERDAAWQCLLKER